MMEIDTKASEEYLQRIVGQALVGCSSSSRGLLMQFEYGAIVLYCPMRVVKERRIEVESILPVDGNMSIGWAEWGRIERVGIDNTDCSLRVLFESQRLLSAFPGSSGMEGVDLIWAFFFGKKPYLECVFGKNGRVYYESSVASE